MMKRASLLHPLLFASYPVLGLFSRNDALIPLTDVWRPLLITLLLVALLWGLVGLVSRNWPRAACIASAIALSFFSFGPILTVLKGASPTLRQAFYYPSAFVPYWLVGGLAVCAWAGWKRANYDALTQFFALMGLVLTLIPAVSILISLSKHTAIVHSSIASSMNEKTDGPDIYYIILDGYGRNDALEANLGFSNRGFIDDLEKRGFYVATGSHSNYCQTELSISSSLNLDYLSKLVPTLDSNGDDREPLGTLIDQNETARILRAHGYRYVAITTDFPAIHPNSADVVISDTRGLTLLESALLASTPLPAAEGSFDSLFEDHRHRLEAALANLGNQGPRTGAPRFIFVHVLAPHPPFVFGPNGEPRRPRRSYNFSDGSDFMQDGGTPAEYRDGYRDQLQFINSKVISALDKVLAASKTKPIIIIQGDHGSKLHLDQQSLVKTKITECFSNLNAYFVPDSIRAKLYEGITPVNSLRLVLNDVVGTQFPPLPDRSFYSTFSKPYRFTDVTERLAKEPMR